MNNIYEKTLPPNFLHSILTNDTLYEMFKNDFASNREYFQGVSRETYIIQIIDFICENLAMYCNTEHLKSFKRFYDDFILPQIDKEPDYIFKLKLFMVVKSIYQDKATTDNEDFLSFYNYIFTSSKYYARCEELLNKIKKTMPDGKLNVSDYETLTNYVKTTAFDYLPVDISCLLIKNHIFKLNHIFDSEVVKKIVKSLAYDFLKKYGIRIDVQYNDLVLSKNVETHDLTNNTIFIDSILIDTFISGNYIELLSNLFFKLMLYRDNYLLNENTEDLETLKAIWRCINFKVEMDKIFIDNKYHPYEYLSEVEANAFVVTLRFLNCIGINLFNKYLFSQTRDLNFNDINAKNSPKEISEEIKFINRFSKMEKEKIDFYRKKYKVLSLFYGIDGKRKKAIELINNSDNNLKPLIFSYLSQIIPEPIYLIDDIVDIAGLTFDDVFIKEFVLKLAKYIYPDMFYYSLDNFIIMNNDKVSFDQDACLSELYVRISSIKETDETKNFLKSALNAVELMKQK